MTPNSPDTLRGDDFRFDRLVDGELGEAERRELLAGLDSEPDGWRRCALAFLEAQCWKETVAQVGGLSARRNAPQLWSLGASAAPSPATAVAGRSASWPGRIGTLAAMAASFLAALWLVSWTQQARIGGRTSPIGVPGATEVAVTGRPEATTQGKPAAGPWQLVTLSSPGNGQEPGRSIRVPAVERDNLDDEWLRNLPPAIPDDVLQALARTGHEVQQRRELVPVPLRDGRRLVVPVDQVEVHYTGNPAY